MLLHSHIPAKHVKLCCFWQPLYFLCISKDNRFRNPKIQRIWFEPRKIIFFNFIDKERSHFFWKFSLKCFSEKSSFFSKRLRSWPIWFRLQILLETNLYSKTLYNLPFSWWGGGENSWLVDRSDMFCWNMWWWFSAHICWKVNEIMISWSFRQMWAENHHHTLF